MFDAIFTALAWLLSFSYAAIPNYAIAIVLLTIAVMLVMFPLNAKAFRSQAAMTKLQPELKKLQQKYKDDPQQQNTEMMALFKEHGASPMGCLLPMLVQMPVLFIMYQVLRGLTHRASDGTFDPKYLDHSSSLYQDLHGAREMTAFGVDLAETASDALSASFVAAIPCLVLIIGVVGAGYYQQRMISRRTPQQNLDDNPMARQMQTMTRIYPLMYLMFGFTLPAGLNVYFLTSSLFRIGQQWIIYQMHPDLLPGAGAPVATSRDVTAAKAASSNGGGGTAAAAPTAKAPKAASKAAPKAAVTSGRVTPAGATATRRSGKKKKRR